MAGLVDVADGTEAADDGTNVPVLLAHGWIDNSDGGGLDLIVLVGPPVALGL